MSDNWIVNLMLTAIVLVMALPGLIIEPGPISEVVALGAIGVIWGVDFGVGGGDDG